MTPVRLEPAALRSGVKHSTTEPLRSLSFSLFGENSKNTIGFVCVDALHPSQQFFSHVGTIFCLLELKQSIMCLGEGISPELPPCLKSKFTTIEPGPVHSSEINQYYADDKVSCSMTQHSVCGESRTSDPWLSSLTL